VSARGDDGAHGIGKAPQRGGGGSGGLSGGHRLENVGPQIVPGLLDVVVHRAARLLGVSGPDGLQDGGVRLGWAAFPSMPELAEVVERPAIALRE
jgi:hypothetical protein